jgi:hypothetical protein
METAAIVEAINVEIQRLQQAKELLSGTTAPRASVAGAKRKMIADGRARIAAAQRARWAKSKKRA